MLIGGIVLVVLAGVLFFFSNKQKQKAGELRLLEPAQAADLLSLQSEIAAELGPGSFEQLCELSGSVECASPLESPFGKRACVHYHTRVVREYEETVTRRQDGRDVTSVQKGSDTVSENRESCAFSVRDASGAIAVELERAELDKLVQTVSRFEPSNENQARFGSFTFNVMPHAGQRRTIGYRYEEHILPLDRKLTVLGPVNDKTGTLAARSAERKLIVSTRSREELVGSALKTSKILLVVAVISALGGVALAIAGVLRPY
ncbi:MAG: E3 ubiquitin ligase family protein [Myxococcota bacterium]|jgi:hypothetical protein|nr:E3 ubiquitin ligase family protein [Myxococcota bacterium]